MENIIVVRDDYDRVVLEVKGEDYEKIIKSLKYCINTACMRGITLNLKCIMDFMKDYTDILDLKTIEGIESIDIHIFSEEKVMVEEISSEIIEKFNFSIENIELKNNDESFSEIGLIVLLIVLKLGSEIFKTRIIRIGIFFLALGIGLKLLFSISNRILIYRQRKIV